MLVAAASALLALASAPQAQPDAEDDAAPAAASYVEALNLHFEAADHPQGWFAGGEGYAAAVVKDEKQAGERSLRLTFVEPGKFGVATSTFPVADARGKKLLLAGYLKTADVSEGWAGLWMRVDGPGGVLAFDNMRQRGVTGTTGWARYEIALDVPQEATNVNFGAILAGRGTVWVDTLSFALAEPDPPPPVVTVRGIVTDPDGQPVASAHVALAGALSSRPVGRARSAANGRFAITAPAGEYALTATAAGHAAAFRAGYLGPEETADDQTLTLGREGFTISGRVTDEAGQPVAGLGLAFLRWSTDLAGGLFYTETDADGRYAVRLIDGDTYGLELDSDDFITAARSVESGADQVIDLRLVRRGPAPDAVVAWIREHAVPLARPEAGRGFDDMKPLAAMVGDARVVALGEATHGTREFFQLKHRFLEFLVEEMGFTVFAIEANWPESLAINDYVLGGEGDAKEALAGIYFWTWNTEEVLELIEWMRRYNADPAHERKVKFYGFDMQATVVAAREALAYLSRVDPERAQGIHLGPLARQDAMEAYQALDAGERRALAATLDRLLERFDAQRDAYVAGSSEREWVLGRQQVVILQQAVGMYGAGNSFNARDAAMAANVRWILDVEPPGTRVVVWAHNGHVSRHHDSGFRPMGWNLAKALDDDYVVFGFAFNRGSFQAIDWTRGRNQPGGLREHTVGPAPPGNLGAAFARTGLPLFVLDLRRRPASGPVADWLAAPHLMRAIGAVFSGEENMSSPIVLGQHFDAVIFVDETTRARPVKR